MPQPNYISRPYGPPNDVDWTQKHNGEWKMYLSKKPHQRMLACLLVAFGGAAGCEGMDSLESDAGMGTESAVQAATTGGGLDGYMVEVQTCNIDKAGTDATITMTMDAQIEPAFLSTKIGPWVQDRSDYNDQEFGDLDSYFFPSGQKITHIEKLTIKSNGGGNSTGWCWNRMYVTRIDGGKVGWTWAYERTSPWIYAGSYDFYFDYGTTGRTLPYGLRSAVFPPLPASSTTEPAPAPTVMGDGATTGGIQAIMYYDIVATQTNCSSALLRVRDTQLASAVMPGIRGEVPPDVQGVDRTRIKRCTWSNTFSGVPLGNRIVDAYRRDPNTNVETRIGISPVVNVTTGMAKRVYFRMGL
jgi:hypothetical protein